MLIVEHAFMGVSTYACMHVYIFNIYTFVQDFLFFISSYRVWISPLLPFQPESECRPLMSEVVQSLVRLVQRASANKRRSSGDDQAYSQRFHATPEVE
jgi:hypothetical protein